MTDGKISNLCSVSKEAVCIDTYRVLDQCRDKDCFENTKVFLTSFGREIIERTSNVRAKWAKAVSAFIDVDDVPFNCGFYQLRIKIFVKLIFEACLGAGAIQEFEGVTVLEKKVVLFGGEGAVNVFKSSSCSGAFCPDFRNACEPSVTLPVAVLETVDPVILDTKVVEPSRACECRCCCSCCDIPDAVSNCIGGALNDYDEGNTLSVTLGLFSVVRIERPAQLLVTASEYAVPEKECVAPRESDPCSIFRSMPFPVSEFTSCSASCKNNCC